MAGNVLVMDTKEFRIGLARKNMSQNELARIVGISGAKMSQFKSLNAMPEDIAAKVSKALDVELNDMFHNVSFE